MADTATVITAIIGPGGLLALGGTVRFLWNKVEARFAKIETDLAACRDRERAADSRGAIKLTVIELLWQEVDRLTPTKPNSTLQRVKRLLDNLKLSAPEPDLDALAAEIDRQRGKP